VHIVSGLLAYSCFRRTYFATENFLTLTIYKGSKRRKIQQQTKNESCFDPENCGMQCSRIRMIVTICFLVVCVMSSSAVKTGHIPPSPFPSSTQLTHLHGKSLIWHYNKVNGRKLPTAEQNTKLVLNANGEDFVFPKIF
jgi:hypothetical protein